MISDSRVTAKPQTSDADVVLPRVYYTILIAELFGLVLLQRYAPEASGADANSYALGWTGVASMLVMHVYSLRRRVRALRHLGALRHWLHFHIFCGLQGAMFVTYHSWHTRHLRNLQGFNIVCVAVVVLSGFFGRYLFSFLPRSVEGERLNGADVDAELARLAEIIDARAAHSEITVPVLKFTALDVAAPSALSIFSLVREHVRISIALFHLRQRLRTQAGDPAVAELARIARARLRLSSRRDTLAAAARLFARWTWFHRPLTFILLGLTVLHIFAHYVYGAR